MPDWFGTLVPGAGAGIVFLTGVGAPIWFWFWPGKPEPGLDPTTGVEAGAGVLDVCVP